jgi:hypothetical protein
MVKSKLLPLLVFFSLAGSVFGQNWSGVLDPTRAVDWSQAGAGTIPNRTTVCSTLNPGASASQIASAVSACPAGQVVFLNAGTYNLSAGILMSGNVTLRGAGADQTRLVFTSGNGCGGVAASICVFNGDSNYKAQPGNTANWTSGYAKGATQITLSSVSNLQVGSLVILDQLQDSVDDHFIYQAAIPGVTCINNGNSTCDYNTRNGRPQFQIVTVAACGTATANGQACNGTNVTISPGLYMPNWNALQSPGAWWSSNLPITGVGIENLSIDSSASASANAITFFNGARNWIKGIRSLNPHNHHVEFWQSAHITVRDSYFWSTQSNVEESYGIEAYPASDDLVENNIFHHISNPMLLAGATGDVYAYNYSLQDVFGDGTWAMQSNFTHAAGTDYDLFEGNDGYGLMLEDYWGPAFLMTAFRNRYIGFESGNTAQTIPIYFQSHSRLNNVVGNVLGTSGYHNHYASLVGDGASITTCYHSIYAFGQGGNCSADSIHASDDVFSTLTQMRWGNWDVVTGVPQFNPSEVPVNIAKYANAVPSSQALPASFYLSVKPSWWGSTVSWPAIGPDVTGGNLANAGGHANKIPARVCFEGAPSDGTNSYKLFSASTCYANSGSPAPAPPTNLQVVVH